ncbi:MAG: hypothetical protein ACFCVA_11435 [Gammaproteobacteria bacterium]
MLAFLFWLAVMNGVAAAEFRRPEITRWIEAVRRWELTGMVAGNPHTSWAALLSALSHSYFAAEAPEKSRAYDFAGAWREALHFTATRLLRDIAPDAVPELWELAAYRRAAALLRNEEQDYLSSLPRAICLQLLVPVVGPEPRKDLLVDAYLTVETWLNGARKLFARLDRTHSHTGQGFAVMGVYRPDPRIEGTGDDRVASVNPLTGISLQDLWLELERLENERWEGQRPTATPRAIASYPAGTGYTQPWWDDQGRYTLLGAPRRLPDGRAGQPVGLAGGGECPLVGIQPGAAPARRRRPARWPARLAGRLPAASETLRRRRLHHHQVLPGDALAQGCYPVGWPV